MLSKMFRSSQFRNSTRHRRLRRRRRRRQCRRKLNVRQLLRRPKSWLLNLPELRFLLSVKKNPLALNRSQHEKLLFGGKFWKKLGHRVDINLIQTWFWWDLDMQLIPILDFSKSLGFQTNFRRRSFDDCGLRWWHGGFVALAKEK